ncbi:hypothetical protein EYZ11_003394 [Aspergillus tanneri]|uniref:Integral membrane protein n=1 Tax=Aspergillus tanneri TaxID=1220188 RepID=A0A4S3JTK4_9EURO|nr:uncharacterized protein ATNIH1004_010448 [Aspergillus tanneri]KAA8643674.1 hypothetical protein ATNIH1004_010448 [Aspergillus tanneri]THC97131.1 hypothetical protein EYZ11_003394 [Aspergillus tanneri]
MALFNKKQRLTLASFTVIYILLLLFCRFNSARDPGSAFFQPRAGYRPQYSLKRIDESLQFLSTLNQSAALTQDYYPRNRSAPIRNVDVCVGIVTVKRPLRQNLDTTIGSILDNLTKEQRSTLAVQVLFALTNATDHPNYQHSWVPNAIDRILTYEDFRKHKTVLRRLETLKNIKKKSLIDYRLSLQSCYEDTDAPWFMMLEDDVLAHRAWYKHTMESIRKIDGWKKSGLINDWLYLRLFYTEKFLGWNKQHWPIYLSWSVVIVSLIASMGLYGRRRFHPLRQILTNQFLAVICFICVPLLIGLFFMSGRVTVRPMKPGIHLMNRNGCCSQALVFPRETIPDLVDRLEDMEDERRPKAVDTVIERLGNELNYDRLAISPPLMQHVGAASYKQDKKKWNGEYPVRGAHGVWSMEFERAHDQGIIMDGLTDAFWSSD